MLFYSDKKRRLSQPIMMRLFFKEALVYLAFGEGMPWATISTMAYISLRRPAVREVTYVIERVG